MNKARKKRRVKQLYALISIALAFVSAVLLWYYNVGVHWRRGFFGYRTLLVVGILYSFTYWFFAKMYNAHKIGLYRLTQLAFSQLLSFGISDFILFVASFFWFHNFRKNHPSYFLIALVLQLFAILVIIFICNRFYARYDTPRKIIIIYGSDEYLQLKGKLQAVPYRYKLLGCYQEETDLDILLRAINSCQDVYLYDVSLERRSYLMQLCEKQERDIHVSLTLDDIQRMSLEISHTLDIPLARTKKVPIVWYYPRLKRLFDILFSLCSLLILSPFMLLVAALIHFYDGGPVFYKQTRLTMGGREFTIYKFRSMIVNAEEQTGATLAHKQDDRITPVGRVIRMIRFDELPQLINILKGDMTLVGPRPERPEIARAYEKDLPEFSQRLKVKAGLTGYAQVYGKYNTSPGDKLKMDLLYIHNQSLTTDFQIIFYTLKILFIPESTEGI